MDLAFKDKYKQGEQQMKEMLGEIHKENQKPSEAKEEDDILNDLLMDDEEAEEIMERMKKEKMDYKGGDNYEEKQ